MPLQLPHQNALDATAEVPGTLKQWLRSRGGEWLGLVDYEIPFADGRHRACTSFSSFYRRMPFGQESDGA
jgi:hypothetical protein